MQRQAAVAALVAAVAFAIEVEIAHQFEHRDYFDMRMVGEEGVFRWNTYSAVQEFSMDVGAEVEITMLHADHPVTFSLYNYAQWDVYRSLVFEITSMAAYDETMALTCMYPSEARIPFDPRTTNTTTFRIPITVSSQYTLQVESCLPAYNLVRATVAMRNIAYDGSLTEHLGVDQLGMPPVYMIMTMTFSFLTLLWGIDCHLKDRPTYALHHVFGLALAVRSVECAIKA
ncbi:hypothetical protein ACHHYP_00910 [Achlya hypogyna]|uniref:Secreted protein n=1 Tax=Achlya hypogyna TaxID=1202772 RepID=A0A1V9Z9W2_ACHHY|nr:hypothetical protein ACHHYP_00910 [Achlya hypogyna]